MKRLPKKKPAKKSRKEEYEEKNSPENRNPTGMGEYDILKGIAHNTIVPGEPPKNKKCTSSQWKMGIKFLFFAQPREEIPNWYYCEKCNWLQNAVLGGGTGNLLHHARSHEKKLYTLKKEQLEEALLKCCEYVKSTGKMPDLKKMPLPDAW